MINRKSIKPGTSTFRIVVALSLIIVVLITQFVVPEPVEGISEKDWEFIADVRVQISLALHQMQSLTNETLESPDLLNPHWWSGIVQMGTCKAIKSPTSDFANIPPLWQSEVCNPYNGIKGTATKGLETLNELKAAGGTIDFFDFWDELDTMKGFVKKVEDGCATVEAALVERIDRQETSEETLNKFFGCDPSDDSIGCFIATAAYGSPMAEEIAILHLFRDEFLMQSTGGKAFIAFYYLASPPVAEYISEHEILRIIVRDGIVDPVALIVERTMDWWNK